MPHDVEKAVPHRDPFLLVDAIEEISAEHVVATYTPKPDHPLWKLIYSGHYPEKPITPGVLLCEMLFQAAAAMVGETTKDAPNPGTPVVTRINQAKFKNIVRPGEKLTLTVKLSERLANAFFMKGSVKSGGKTVLQAEFAVALADPDS